MRITQPLYLVMAVFFIKYRLQSSHLPQMQLLPEVPTIMSMNYQSISNGQEKAYHPMWNTGPTSVFIAHVCEIVPKQRQSATRSIYARRPCLKHQKKIHHSLPLELFWGLFCKLTGIWQTPQRFRTSSHSLLIIYHRLLPLCPLHSRKR